MKSGRNWAALALVGVVLALLRLPSLVEPAWYPDEGTYADIGYALAHGAHLYVGVWDNKPPGVYWVAWLVATHGSPQFWLALTAFGSAAISCLAVYGITTHLRGRAWGAAAAVSMAVLVSLPTLDGDLFNAEPAGAAAAAVAMWLVVARPRGKVSLSAAGVCLGVAFLFKAVFALDALAAMAAIWLVDAGVTGAQLRRRLITMLGGLFAVLVMAAGALLLSGSLGAAARVLVSADTGYVGSVNGSPGVPGSISALLSVLRVAAPLVAAAFCVRVWRRQHPAVVAMLLWLALDVCGAVISARGFTHYIQQTQPALCVVTALLGAWLWSRKPARPLAVLALLAQPFICLALLWLPRAQTALMSGAGLPKFEAGNFVARQLAGYYSDGYGALIGDAASRTKFDALMPADLVKQRAAVQWFSGHSRPGDRVFVWGSIHWAYVLSGRVPAGRYVTLNSAYYLEPGSAALLESDLRAHLPVVLIADAGLPAAVQAMLDRGHYVRHAGVVAGDDVWVAPGESGNPG